MNLAPHAASDAPGSGLADAGLASSAAIGTGSSAGTMPTLRAGFEGSGSPRWLMRTLQRGGFDRSRGFVLDLVLLPESGQRHGTLQALADGRVDLVDADQQALAAAQADGLPLLAIGPYGRILGSVVMHRHYRPGGDANGLDALRGGVLGVLSTSDKNWRLLDKACRQLAGFELAAAVTTVAFQRRSELVAAFDAGAIDAALLHWHLVPALVAAGHRVLAELPELADALAKTPAAPVATPTTFFVVHHQLAQQQPALVAALVAATTQAVSQLRDDTLAWQALADEGAVDARHLAALRARWQGRVGACHPPATHSSDSTTSMQTTFRSTPCNPF